MVTIRHWILSPSHCPSLPGTSCPPGWGCCWSGECWGCSPPPPWGWRCTRLLSTCTPTTWGWTRQTWRVWDCRSWSWCWWCCRRVAGTGQAAVFSCMKCPGDWESRYAWHCWHGRHWWWWWWLHWWCHNLFSVFFSWWIRTSSRVYQQRYVIFLWSDISYSHPHNTNKEVAKYHILALKVEGCLQWQIRTKFEIWNVLNLLLQCQNLFWVSPSQPDTTGVQKQHSTAAEISSGDIEEEES